MGRFPLELIFSLSPAHLLRKKVCETTSVLSVSFSVPPLKLHIKIVFSLASIVELNLP